ncbi:unnamed protein product [Rotaria sordida]|uniref:Transcriptional adapter 2-alpha/beta-like domain-containing protein n=2 Tax=Rotaria sordida TaxID=392033 RepID=A0A814R8S1_9BILA|nr:unnamed protein product [Rotaria sordida]
MSKCDYCCIRPSSLIINCLKCSPYRQINICFKCSINVNQLREHAKHHPLSTYKLNDIPLDDNSISSWLSNDEINLIEIIESCGLGNWNDIDYKISRNEFDSQNHFEDIYLSRSTSPFYIYFQSFKNNKQLYGEYLINKSNIQIKYLIYPPMLIDSEQQKLLTYLPYRDEYEREYLNQAENRLPFFNNDQLFHQYNQQQQQQQEQQQQQTQQDGSTILLDNAKLSLLRSYGQILRRRLQLKDFIRDYALGFNYSPDQQMDLHQISRFLSADQYERLIFNHRRIRTLLEEVGCSTSSNQDNDQSPSRKKSSLLNNEKRRRRSPSNVIDECSSICSNDSNESFESSSQIEEINSNLKRRSVRRVSSSSTNTSSKTTFNKEPLYKRRRIYQSDNHNLSQSQRMTRSTGCNLTTSDISWDSTDDEINHLSDNYSQYDKSTVASRTRSHTPPHYYYEKKQTRNSPNGKRTNNHINGLTKTNIYDGSDQSTSTPKINRMLTRHQLVVQQTSPNKKRKINSNSNDDQHFLN